MRILSLIRIWFLSFKTSCFYFSIHFYLIFIIKLLSSGRISAIVSLQTYFIDHSEFIEESLINSKQKLNFTTK